jgi:hypothetical protein
MEEQIPLGQNVRHPVATLADLPVGAQDRDICWVGPSLPEQAAMLAKGEEPPAWAGCYEFCEGEWLKRKGDPVGEQKLKVFHAGDDEPSWVTVHEYLERYVSTLIPMSVGQCFRFSMGHQVLDIEPRLSLGDVFAGAELHGRGGVFASPNDGVILILPRPVRVDVTFEGNHVIKAAGLAPPKPDKPIPTIESEMAALMAKGELKLEPYQKRLAKLFEDKTARVSMSSRRSHARLQILHYAKLRADPGCAICGGGGILQQQRIGDTSTEEFCVCCLSKSK